LCLSCSDREARAWAADFVHRGAQDDPRRVVVQEFDELLAPCRRQRRELRGGRGSEFGGFIRPDRPDRILHHAAVWLLHHLEDWIERLHDAKERRPADADHASEVLRQLVREIGAAENVA